MTTEAQLIALFTFLGWTEIKPSRHNPDRLFGIHPTEGRCEMPKLTLDLMHEAEMKLGEAAYRLFIGHLVSLLKPGEFSVRASKENRLEALLKTVGKYVPTPCQSPC